VYRGRPISFNKLEYGERFARDLKAPLFTIKEGKHFTPEDHPVLISQELMALVQHVRSSE
jgi:pimeloyl-ACP methyl ester carboxylesterase